MTSAEEEKVEEDNFKKTRIKTRTTILIHNEDKQPKFDKAMALFTHAFSMSKLTKAVDQKDSKEDQSLAAFYDNLSYHCNVKDPNYKNTSSIFGLCFKKLDEGCIFTQLGVNDIHIRVSPDNFGSIIGFALTSNIYFDGLIYFNYLNLKNKLLVQRESMKGADNSAEHIIHLTKEDETDVFNSPVPTSHIEKELQKGNKENFIFVFCNYKYDDVKMFIELDGEKEEFMKNQNSKYYNRPTTKAEERENNDKCLLKDSPYDYLKLDDKTPEALLEFMGILSAESHKGTESLFKSLKKERDN